jgi:hypothetical protein
VLPADSPRREPEPGSHEGYEGCTSSTGGYGSCSLSMTSCSHLRARPKSDRPPRRPEWSIANRCDLSLACRHCGRHSLALGFEPSQSNPFVGEGIR